MNYLLMVSVIIIVIISLYFLITFNSFVRLNNQVKESFSTMDVYLKKRWNLIPNLVEMVKGCAKHEKDTFKEITALRSGEYEKLSQDEKIKTNENINGEIIKLMAVAESYPELKANQNFLLLSNELSSVEDEIAQSRKYYNAVIRVFNNKVEMVPSNIVAKILGYKTKEMFKVENFEKKSLEVDL